MIIIQQPSTLLHVIYKQKNDGHTVGFVPTMGALHAGHLQLVKECRERSDYSVCSIFVNPTQFNDPSDFRKYPNRLAEDIRMLESSGADILFLPAVAAVYPRGTDELEHYDLGPLETIWEGKYRPGHFQGVCQVMARLLKAVTPDLLFMGQKDYQQCMVVQRLLNILAMNTTLVACATVREADGLAMSSRNLRLDVNERHLAPEIYKALLYLKDNINGTEPATLRETATVMLEEKGFRVDYVAIADATTLAPLEGFDDTRSVVALVAAFLGEVRLIDNMIVRQ